MPRRTVWLPALALVVAGAACDDATGPTFEPTDPNTAPKASVDRFSDAAATLFRRSENPELPGANEPIDFDQAPFITQGLGPAGEVIQYYNFDVMATTPAPIFVLFREGETMPVEGQLNIIDVIPGDEGYNDFWQVVRVTVPEEYVANAHTSLQELQDAGYAMETTNTLVNCPVVPEGSTAELGGGADGLVRGWYRDEVVFYFTFDEKALTTTGAGEVLSSPIYVSFNINPGETGGGPASGFMAEEGSTHTHNVAATLPSDEAYSPLWFVNVYDNADFAAVHDLASATDANILATGAALVNCPIVGIASAPADPDAAAETMIDRFSDAAGTLFRRSGNAALPAAGEAIDFDQAPFITDGLGPTGQLISYYNFDVQSTTPAPIYVLFREGSDTPVPGQLNIVDVVPGEAGYNDMWQVVRVTVPRSYVANTVTSVQEITDAGYATEATSTLVNCPIVPDGSTADVRLGGEDNGLVRGWYKGEVVYYFNFLEAGLETTEDGLVPLSPIFVTFNINPGEPGGGPPSGFMTEPGSDQTHNVAATVPGDAGYSPYWHVHIYDNADFDTVSDLESAMSATLLSDEGPTVNCPIVAVSAGA
jgi:hypothetical protein